MPRPAGRGSTGRTKFAKPGRAFLSLLPGRWGTHMMAPAAAMTPRISWETVTVDGGATALGSAGPFTLVVDRPAGAGGRGLGFNGGQLLNLAVAACLSNDLFREAARTGLALRRVRVAVASDYAGEPAVSGPIDYDVELDGDAPEADLRALLEAVDRIAEIPNSLRRGTDVRLRHASVKGR